MHCSWVSVSEQCWWLNYAWNCRLNPVVSHNLWPSSCQLIKTVRWTILARIYIGCLSCTEHFKTAITFDPVEFHAQFKGQMMNLCWYHSLCEFVDRNTGVMRVFSPKYPHMRVDPHLYGYVGNTAAQDVHKMAGLIWLGKLINWNVTVSWSL